MDSLTHILAGAAVGELILGKRLGNRAMLWGALFASLADVDVVAAPFLNPANYLAFRYGVTHSLLFLGIATGLLAPWLVKKRWAKEKIGLPLAVLFVFCTGASHLLIDTFTSHGTQLLWPFRDTRFAFQNLFPTDPFFTGPLLVAVVLAAFFHDQKSRAKRLRAMLWGLGMSSAYIGLSFFGKWLAATGFEADLQRRGVAFTRRIEVPTPFNILLWRSVVECGDELWVGYRSVFEFRETPVRWTIYPRGRDIFESVTDQKEIQTLARFSDGWWIARPQANGVWVGDLRFCESRVWGAKKDTVDSKAAFAWVFTPTKEKSDRLQQLASLRSTDISDTLRRMGFRILGKRDEWEAIPRLANVPGTLPEVLRVEE